MRSLLAIMIVTVVGWSEVAETAEPTTVVVGHSHISWHGLPGVDGRRHSIADLADRDVVVVAVTCNHCPIAIEYYDRMKEFVHLHCGPQGRVTLVAVSLSDLESDRLEPMRAMAARQGFNFPYLYDSTQQLGKLLGATNTPQFFVLDRQRVLAYRGAWDDNLNASRVSRRYVEDAVAAVLAGHAPLLAETRPRGCPINYR